MTKLRWLIACTYMLLNFQQSQAVQVSENLNFSGFGTLGLTKTSDADYGYRNGLSTDAPVYDEWDLSSRSLVGFQLNYRFTDRWSSVLQMVHQKQNDNDLNRNVRMASINYQIDPEWQIRVGRFSPKVFTLTDSRPGGYGYLWTVPPVEFYGELDLKSYDGVEVNYTHQLDEMILRTSFGVGKTSMPVTYSEKLLNLEFSPTIVLNQDIEWRSFIFRGSVSAVRNKNQWVPELIQGWDQVSDMFPIDAQNALNRLDTKDSTFWLYSLGATYDDGDWLIQSEVSRFVTTNDIAVPTVSAYLSVGHRFGAFTPYFLLSQIHSSTKEFTTTSDYQLAQQDPFIGSQLTQLAYTTNLAQTSMSQRSIGAGIRWDLSEHFALKFQWDRKFVEKNATSLWWRASQSTSDKTIDVFMINLDYVF